MSAAQESYRKRLGYQAGLLGGMALLASATLVIGDLHTREAILTRRAEDLQASLSQVIPAAMHDNDLLQDRIEIPASGGNGPVTVYRATRGGEVVAVAYTVTGQGYGGEIRVLLGVDRRGRILGVRVLSHSETPGLGDKIEARRSPWIHGFEGRSLDDPPPGRWKVRKDGGVFDQFTGATITPRAMVAAVREGLELYRRERGRLLHVDIDKPEGTEP